MTKKPAVLAISLRCAARLGLRRALTPALADDMSDLIRISAERGDLAHLALFLWASAALLFTLRDPYSAKPYVLFYTTKRVGGGVQDFDAIKLVKLAAS